MFERASRPPRASRIVPFVLRRAGGQRRPPRRRRRPCCQPVQHGQAGLLGQAGPWQVHEHVAGAVRLEGQQDLHQGPLAHRQRDAKGRQAQLRGHAALFAGRHGRRLGQPEADDAVGGRVQADRRVRHRAAQHGQDALTGASRRSPARARVGQPRADLRRTPPRVPRVPRGSRSGRTMSPACR